MFDSIYITAYKITKIDLNIAIGIDVIIIKLIDCLIVNSYKNNIAYEIFFTNW